MNAHFGAIELGELMVERGGSTDPSQHSDTMFALYSIPAFDAGKAELVVGADIGSSKKNVEPADVLLSRIVPHIRRAWIVGQHSEPIIASSEWIVFRDRRVYPNYLRHFLMSDLFHTQFMMTVAGVGGSLLRARPADVARIVLDLPPLDEQRRLAAILDKADTLRQKRKRAMALLDGLTQSIFFEMFGDGSHTKTVPFEEAVYFQEGPGVRNWQFRDHGVKLINVRNIVDGQLVIENTDRYLDSYEAEGKYSHFLLSAGDLVMASSGVTWGKIAEVHHQHLPLCLNTSMIRLRALGAFRKAYVRAFVEGRAFRRQIEKLVTGSAQPNFGPTHLRQVKIPSPASDLQDLFSARCESVAALKNSYLATAAANDAAFASLQHRAFSDP